MKKDVAQRDFSDDGADSVMVAASGVDDCLEFGAVAEADGRSLSNWVTRLISSTVKEAEKNARNADDAKNSD